MFLIYGLADKWTPISIKPAKKNKKHKKQRTDKPLKTLSKGG